jgi:creatinine amidohydrolase
VGQDPAQLAQLAAMTWTAVAGRAATTVLVVPLGSTEQHGPHLPLSTDTDIAVALAERLAQTRPNVLVAPPLPYGASGEHAGFAGTLSIGLDALELLLVELGRSADAFAGVLFLSAHGGNAEALGKAVSRLGEEGRRVTAWAPAASAPAVSAPTAWAPAGGAPAVRDAHAGHTETSVLLAMVPAAVRMDRAEPGARAPLPELLPALRRAGVAGVSANGVLGDPTGASAEAGRSILDGWAADLAASFDAWVGRGEPWP